MGIQVYFSRGLRKIRPYYHKRTAFAKGRWFRRTLLDVLVNEFRSYSEHHYLTEIKKGNLGLIREGRTLDLNEVLSSPIRNNDTVQTLSHKHEPPVLQWSEGEEDIPGIKVAGFDIVYENDDLLVLNKPSGIPIHPTGQFYQNTITELLKKHGKTALPCYRLDKLTSGLLIMAKNTETAGAIQVKIRDRNMSKYYLARVKGKFPHLSSLDFHETLIPFPVSSLVTREESPVYTVEPKKRFPSGLSPVKDAKTDFYPLKYFPHCDQSLVICKPLTGRTHQIRVHLARLGHPIVNDPFYNVDNVEYPTRSKFIIKVPDWTKSIYSYEQLEQLFGTFIQECEKVQENKTAGRDQLEKCSECGSLLLQDPDPRDLTIWLHAWKYEDPQGEFSFTTALPSWADENS